MPDDDLTEEEQQDLDPNIREALRKTRETARKAEAAESRAAELERELAFAKAGIPDNPLNSTLAKSYEGENDPASVRAYFEGLGVDLSGKQAAQQEQVSQAELDQQRQLAQVGSQGDQGGSIDFKDALESAKDVAAVMALLATAPEGATDHEGRRIGVPTIE